MYEYEFKHIKGEYLNMKKIKNPLTIIGLFAGIAEGAGTVVLPFISRELQAIFIWYVMLFPIFLVIIFFINLNRNPKVFYAPSDFEDEANFMKLLMAAETALDDTINSNPDLEKNLKAVEKFIEKIPVNIKEPQVVQKNISVDAEKDLNLIGILEFNGKQIKLIKDRVIIGRSNNADIIIYSHKASRYHCQIYKENSNFYIRDLNSSNGTYVNNIEIIGVQKLDENDILEVGDINLVFKIKSQFHSPTYRTNNFTQPHE